jgi:hypothetical protein
VPDTTDKVTDAVNVEKGNIQMKSVSILQILTALQKVGMCNMFSRSEVAKQKKTEDGISDVNVDDVSDNDTPQGDYVKDGKDEWITYNLTALGRDVVDVFTTIDAINALNTDVNTIVIDGYKVDDYNKLACLDRFIRPSKAIIAEETQGIKQIDMLTKYESICDVFKGEVLSPAMFESAQLRCLRAINKKCSALVDTTSVTREPLLLSENAILAMPVVIDGKLKAVTRGKKFELFALKHQFYPTREYIVVYNNETVNEAMILFAQDVVSAANGRDTSDSSEG